MIQKVVPAQKTTTTKEHAMPWGRFLFKKKEKVFVHVDPDGKPIQEGGLIEIRYQREGRSYRAFVGNLSPHPDGLGTLFPDDPSPDPKPATTPATTAQNTTEAKPADVAPVVSTKRIDRASPSDTERVTQETHADDAVIIYADGACSGNPGPAGVGVFWSSKGEVKEVSEYLGEGTNNIAELTAIKRALELCTDSSASIHLYTDSAYSIGVLTMDWRPKANIELIQELKRMCRKFPKLQFHKVAGHAGIPGNEKADSLARQAVEQRDSFYT